MNVRPFASADIPEVAELHRRVFAVDGRRVTDGTYTDYFETIYLANPWRDASIPSLVCVDTAGRIAAFLGVMPRPLLYCGRPIKAAVSSQFIVEPRPESALIAACLVTEFLRGPQDLSLADEAHAASRRLMQSAGGIALPAQSLFWARLFGPAQFALSRLRKHAEFLARAAWPLAWLTDRLLVAVPGAPVAVQAPASAQGETLTPAALVRCLAESRRDVALCPVYDETSLAWLFDVLTRKHEFGRFHAVGVLARSGERMGWYLYYEKRGGLGEVIQLGFSDYNARHAVLDHLFQHAQSRGVTALSGRIDLDLTEDLARRRCFFHHRGYSFIAHSRHADLLHAMQRGDTALTRMEGEWGMRF